MLDNTNKEQDLKPTFFLVAFIALFFVIITFLVLFVLFIFFVVFFFLFYFFTFPIRALVSVKSKLRSTHLQLTG
jgi:hypothetical protein